MKCFPKDPEPEVDEESLSEEEEKESKTDKSIIDWVDVVSDKPDESDNYDFLLKETWTLETLSQKIKELKDEDVKDPIIKQLEKILFLSNIQFKEYQTPIKNSLKFNYISSFSTTEYSLSEKISHFILKETKQPIRKTNEKLSKLSITDATACIGGNTLSFGKYFYNIDAIELDEDNFKLLKSNIKTAYKFKDLFKPSFSGKVNSYHGDYQDILSSIKHNDIIFLDPPWLTEGETYNYDKPSMPMLGDLTILEVIDNVCKQFEHVFVKLPPRLDLGDFKINKSIILNLGKKPKMKIIYRKCDKLEKDIVKKDKKDKTTQEQYKYILEQRKAYVNWINNEFYDKIIDESDDTKVKNPYQLFVKGYLSLETPFRGLLVYHGLGTGKTATSVITVEGLSPMKINTFLPASLKGNFISEIKKFATDTFNIELNNWVFYTLEEINKDDKIRGQLFNDINIKDTIDTIHRKVNLTLKKEGKLPKKDIQKINTLNDFKKGMNVSFKHKGEVNIGVVLGIKDSKVIVKVDGIKNAVFVKKLTILDEISDAEEDGYNSYELLKGLFININLIEGSDKTIYTVDGELKLNKIIRQQTYDKIEKLTDIQLIQLEIQTDFMINNKYNFIHYNPFPSITKDQIRELNIDGDLYDNILDEKKEPKGNAIIIENLITKLKENKKSNIDSPFNNEVIIFDEVHNFISQIKNDKGPAKLFYNWIINSKDVKIVFLSGTPIINKPSEIAYLFNMLKGKIDVYDFSMKVEGDVDDISRRLKEIFYDNISSVEQLYVKKMKGKVVVSFIKIRSNFC